MFCFELLLPYSTTVVVSFDVNLTGPQDAKISG